MVMKVIGSSGLEFPDTSTMTTGKQAVKAWVNFNGTGTVAIREQYNVSSITDHGTGQYTVNFTTAMSDTNYAIFGMNGSGSATSAGGAVNVGDADPATGSRRIISRDNNGSVFDAAYVHVAIFR